MAREELVKYVRYLLTGALLVGVYSETGWFTALTLGLCVIAIEIICYQLEHLL